MIRRLSTGAAVAAIMFSVLPAAVAQITTGSVRGNVTDSSGGPVGQAAISIRHLPSGTTTTAVTDASGVFDSRGLRVGGPYTIDVTAAGYQARTLEGVFLNVGDVARVDIDLISVTDTIVVTGLAAPRVTSPGSSTSLSRNEIDSVTSVKRDIRDIARRDPLATLDLGSRGTGPSGGVYIAGSNPRANRITIDGVRSADDFGLNTGGLSTNIGPISPEAVEQFSIVAVPFDVEEGDFTGGAINMILRGGGNELEGSAFASIRTEDMTASRIRNANGVLSPVPVFKRDNYGAFVSGPILSDQLFFALSYENFETADATAFGPLGGGFPNAINGRQGAAGAKLTQADIDALLAPWATYAASTRLNPGGLPSIQPIVDEKYSARFDFNISDDHRLQATYRHAESSVWKRQNLGAASVGLDTNWYTQPEEEDNYSAQLNSSWTDAFSTEARVSYREYVRGQEPPTGQTFSEVRVCGDQTALGNPFDCAATNGGVNGQVTLFFGPDQFRHANKLATKNTSASFTGTYALGDHVIKAGAQTKKIDINNLFVFQSDGIYYFDSVTDFTNGRVGQFSYNNAITGNPEDAAAVLTYNLNTLLLQDSWDITPDLTLNAGVRYDFYTSDSLPALNSNFESRYGFDNQATYDGADVLMPRLSARWQATPDLQISGGVGLFSGGLPDVFLSNSFSNTGFLTNSIVLRRQLDGTFLETNSQTVVSAADANQILQVDRANANFGSALPALANSLISNKNTALFRLAETNSLVDGFQLPSDWKANLAIDYDIAGFRVAFDGVFTRSEAGLGFRDLRARLLTINGVQQFTPDGRLRYDGLNITAANRTALGLPTSSNADLVNLGSARDIQAYNPNETSSSTTLAFSVGRSFEDLGLDVDFSYIKQHGSNYGGLPEFATTAGGLYGEQYTSVDPNNAVKGRQPNEISDAAKLSITWEPDWFEGAPTRFSLFGDWHTGRPINFLMSDAAGGRGPVFGVNRSDFLAYIPDMTAPVAGNPLQFRTGSVDVFFDSQASVDNFRRIVDSFGVPAGVLGKGAVDNPDVMRFDFQLKQTVPGFLPDHTIDLTLDVQNIGNMLNADWGLVEEYTDSRAGGRIANVSCATVTGAAITNSSAACPAYRYSGVNTNILTPTINPETSGWTVLLGLRYGF